jgi:dTDP-4-dehydrorhamnose reductase
MAKVLITGASGFLGTKVFDLYNSNPENEVIGTYSSHPREGFVPLDITNRSQTYDVITNVCPTIVIHTVALSDPDVCELRKEDAERINHLGTRNIVQACQKTGARLDYISTVYVFDGAKGNYTEEDETHPINWYGETKRRAEQEVSTLPNFGIYRFDKLYGYNGEGKPNDTFSKIAKGKPFEVNSDQIRQPVFVNDVVRAIQLVQERSINGIFHLAGPDRISKYELTIKLAHLLEKEGLVVPISEKEQIARRPKDASISTARMEGLGMKFTSLGEALSQIEAALITKGVERSKGIER